MLRRGGDGPNRAGGAVAARLRLGAVEDRCLVSFNAAVNYPVGSSPQAVVAADFNNDAHLEVAVANAEDGM